MEGVSKILLSGLKRDIVTTTPGRYMDFIDPQDNDFFWFYWSFP